MLGMTVKEVREALSRWPDNAEVTTWFGNLEGLRVAEVNQPDSSFTEGPVIWVAESKVKKPFSGTLLTI